MYKLTFFVPVTHLEPVKAALFQAGAGQIGDYSECCWQVLGQGQFKPLAGSQPYLGTIQQLETVAEYRVEMVVQSELIHAVVTTLKQAHPYETPAYDVLQMVDI